MATSYGKELLSETATTESSETAITEPMMPWLKMTVDDAVLALWPGSDFVDPEGLKAFFKETFDIEPTRVGCIETLPNTDAFGDEIEGTGGRHDFFFFINVDDVPKFAVKRLRFGMRWWEDVYFNDGYGIYPMEFRRAYPTFRVYPSERFTLFETAGTNFS